MRPSALLAALVLGCSAPAFAAGIGTPDGRIAIDADAGPGGSGVEAGLAGRLGAYGFSNRSGVWDEGARVTNPPLSGAWTLGPRGFAIERDETFGPPTAHATLGTGGITEGVDETGRLTGLGWPGPGWYDHVDHIHVSRGHPNAGAPLNGGSFAGSGNAWLTPEHGWRTISQAWASDSAQTLVTTLEHADRGLTATITDVVDPIVDLIARNVRFSHPAGAFAYYANFSPTTARLPRAPSVTDGVADAVSDFATVYDDARSLLLHFRPYRVDPVPLTTLATSHEGAARAREAVRGTFGPGVYIATAGQGRAAEHQAGLDSKGFVRGEAEGTSLLDPYYDLDDGRLSGSDAAFGFSAGALAGLPPDSDGSYTVFLAAASSAGEAMGIVDHARGRGFEGVRADSESWWHTWLARARLPATTDARTLAVSRHALMLIRTAMDRRSGSIVANATVQTPYRQDWVRDGAFFNYALLLAGYPELAKEHADFYRRVYRPGGTWDSLYYADGGEAGLVYPYEIDSQAFALWALWLPAEFDPADRAYLERVYPAISDTANALLLCRDPFNGLQCRAAEDDAVQPTQGTQGASTMYLALRSATAAARALGVQPDPRWSDRANELRAAALEHLCTRGACGGGRGGVYMVWPSRLLDPTSSLVQTHLRGYVRELDARASFTSPELGGFFQYPMEPLIALAPVWIDAAREHRLATWIRWLTHDVAEPGVLHYGERIFRVSEPGAGPVYLHSVGFPHIWSGTEMYIAAAFVHGLQGCPAGEQIGEAPCRG